MRRLEIKGSHSGHTLVAAVLDCHPNVVVANRYGWPLTTDDVLNSRNDLNKWVGVKYNFVNRFQIMYKSEILYVANTGVMADPDKIVGVVRNPYAMAFSLIKKHKTEENTIKFLLNIFKNLDNEYKIFYEDILSFPLKIFSELAVELKLQTPDFWLSAAENLVRKNIPQPKLDIDLSGIFDKYEWLGRYKK